MGLVLFRIFRVRKITPLWNLYVWSCYGRDLESQFSTRKEERKVRKGEELFKQIWTEMGEPN